MSDPILTLGARFTAALAAALGPEHAAVDPALRRSDRADYQANLAMSLAKKLGKKPRDVAEAIVAKLDVSGVCERVEIAGPGFINLVLERRFLEEELGRAARDERVGVPRAPSPKTVVVDYSAPNVAKEMHVGHLRTTVIGDALCRTLEFLGHRVIRQNHIGDWGTPFGMLIEHLHDQGAGSGESSIHELNAFYRAARAKFDGDPAFAERSRQRVVRLQAGDQETLASWGVLVEATKRHLREVYTKLGVTLTDADIRGESFYNSMLPEVVQSLEAKGVARESQGALCVFVPGFTGREGEPVPLIVRKQDGGYGYGATDVAALRYRANTLAADTLLYVVGAPQQQHLAMVFETCRMAGWVRPDQQVVHVAFGSILGADRKMYKTRSGDTVALLALLDEAVDRAAAVMADKSPDLDEATRRDVAKKIGIGAVKYADLANDRIKDYVFDWDRMLAFEGNTAPYLQYAHARIRSIFRRGEAPVPPTDTPFQLTEPSERALALELLSLPGAVEGMVSTWEPHRLAGHLFTVATAFTAFYERCPVLKAPDAQTQRSRLALCDLSARVLATGLGLLGIEAPDRM